MLDPARPLSAYLQREQECLVFAESRKEQAMASLVNLDIWKHMSDAHALTMFQSAKSVDGVEVNATHHTQNDEIHIDRWLHSYT
jgi:hypothetical protein